MLTRKISLFLSALMLTFFVQPLMGQKDMKKTDKKKSFYVTEEGTKYKVIGWESNVVYNPYTVTWYEWETPVTKKVKVKKVYPVPVSEFDRTPLFSTGCLNAEDQVSCTNKELQAYIENQNFDYPDDAQDNLQAGLEYVSFVLTKEGKIENISVLSKEKPCKGCADAAADIIASTEGKWYPAIKSDKPVTTKITVPVRFKLISTSTVDFRR